MNLLDIYKTNPKHLLDVVLSDFDDAQWQDLAIHLGSYQRDAYDGEVMRHLLPIIGNRVLWLNTTSAQQFLYTAIFNNDAVMVDFILNTFENVRNGTGVIEGWEGYVETAVQEKLGHPQLSYAVLDRLLQTFDNKYGLGLLRCVQNKNLEVLRYMLPHSDAADDYFLAYRWAQVYGLLEFEEALNPLSDKLTALFGYRFEAWVEEEDGDKERAQQVSDQLEQDILNGMYDGEPLAALYRKGCVGAIQWEKLLNTIHEDRVRLALLWCGTAPYLAQEVLKTVDTIDDEMAHIVARCFRDHPEIVVTRLSEQQRCDELYNCAHHPQDKAFAQHLVKAGTDPQKVLVKLMEDEKKYSSVHPAFAHIQETRGNAVDVLRHWISEWQAQRIYERLGHIETGGKVSKI